MRLHIGNLSTGTTDQELTDLLGTVHRPDAVEIIRDSNGASKGFGFADFANDDEAKAVIDGVNGKDFGGNQLKLGEARPRKNNSKA